MTASPQQIEIDPAIEETAFACDLIACRGACCTLPGGRGAPLLDEELEHLTSVLPSVLPSLSEAHREALDRSGPVEGTPGDFHTTCVDDAACVFVTYDGPIALCSIEQAFHRGEVSWRKPVSCHLFPVRIDRGSEPRIRFEYIPECRPALHKGALEGIPLVTFLASALQRALGSSWSSFRERLRA